MVDAEILAALEAFDGAFAAGDADALAERFAVDARLLLLHTPEIQGRDAIREHWAAVFARHDTSAWGTDWEIVDRSDDRATGLAAYTETLVPRVDGPRFIVNGRLVLFLQREVDGAWRVRIAMNSHRIPVERVEPERLDPGPGVT
jgi:uncharacterized protein (TIGR02246 family)